MNITWQVFTVIFYKTLFLIFEHLEDSCFNSRFTSDFCSFWCYLLQFIWNKYKHVLYISLKSLHLQVSTTFICYSFGISSYVIISKISDVFDVVLAYLWHGVPGQCGVITTGTSLISSLIFLRDNDDNLGRHNALLNHLIYWFYISHIAEMSIVFFKEKPNIWKVKINDTPPK